MVHIELYIASCNRLQRNFRIRKSSWRSHFLDYFFSRLLMLPQADYLIRPNDERKANLSLENDSQLHGLCPN